MWGHLIAIGCLALTCFVWVLIQRNSGREGEAMNGSCGACGRQPTEACGTNRTCLKKAHPEHAEDAR